MKKPPAPRTARTALRRRAEAQLKARKPRARSGADTQKLLHELQVHQIELELQNEELSAAREALERTLADYTELYDFAPVGYLTLDPSGLIRRANLTAATLLGVARSKMLKQRFGRFVIPEGRAAFNALLARSFATKAPEEADVQLQVEGQPPRTVHVRTAALEDGRECQVVLTDLTRRLQMEEELRRSERLFRLAFEESPVGRCLVGADGRIGKTNHAFCALLGRSQQELAGLNFLEITHPEDRQASAEGVRQLQEGTLDRLDLEKRYLTAEQQTVWASVRVGLLRDEAGSPLHFSVYAQDISERKRAEAALLEREEQLRGIASSIPGALYQVIQRTDGTFEIPFMSESAQALFGRPMAELQDPARILADFHPEDLPKVWASIEASAKDLAPWSAEFRLVPKRAPLRWLRGASNPRRLPDGGICWNGVLLDITEQKRGDEQTRLQHRLALALAAASDLQQGLRLCVEIAVQATGMDSGGFYVVEEGSGALAFLVPQGLSSAFVQAVSRYEATSDHTRLVKAGSPIYARFEDLGLSLSEAERREGLRFIAVIPMRHDGTVIGCLNVASHTVDGLPPASRQVLETIAATGTQAIVRLQAEERLRRSEALLNHTQRLSKAGGWEWDAIRQTMVWTEETYRLHGLKAKDFAPGSQEHIQRSVGCYAAEHQATILEAFRRCTERGEAYDLEVPFTNAAGRRMWVRTTAEAVWDGDRVVKVLGNLMDITERKQAAEELAGSRAALRALTARLESIREQERQHLAREIHDTFGHALTEWKFDLAWLGRRLAEAGFGGRTALRRKLAAMSRRAEAEMESVRRIAGELRPALLDTVGLPPAIEWLARDFQVRTRIRSRADLPSVPLALAPTHATALYRVLQELLVNVARHAQARAVDIRLTSGADWVELRVRDDGCGISPRAAANPTSLGLLGIRERVAALGGAVVIRGVRGKGTTATVRLPLTAPAKPD